MEDAAIYGFSICGCLEYNIQSKRLININNGKIKKIGETKALLFFYLLNNASQGIILDDDIFIDVFEKNGLRCSKSYLWRMIRLLHLSFISVGCERAPFHRFERKGYLVESERIFEIYIRKCVN